MAHEGAVTLRWVSGLLGADAELTDCVTGIFNGSASQDQKTPYVIFANMSDAGGDRSAGARISDKPVLKVEVIGIHGEDDEDVVRAVGRIEALLEGAKAVIGDQRLRCWGQGILPEIPEPRLGGGYYRHMGRLWLVTIGKTGN